ncbi:hypothetical protein L3V82_00995 [Thiotrichales bacterium 19S3-7]|nr:hypothetical protein [Thiotrichales bacterium 19S3-7]MCF6800738.1 hypothetical protein [Thiotrichales bacterium 19S3-11]
MITRIIKNKLLKGLLSLSLILPSISHANTNSLSLYDIINIRETINIFPLAIVDFGLGDVDIKHCGKSLLKTGKTIYYGTCPKLIDNTHFDVSFTKTKVSCHITVDNQNAAIKQIDCQNNTVTSYIVSNQQSVLPSHQSIVFLCQQTNSQTNACPWVIEKNNS